MIIHNNYMSIITILCSNIFKKWIYYFTSLFDWRLDKCIYICTLYNKCLYTPFMSQCVSMTYFLSYDSHEYSYFQGKYKESHINFTIILHNVSYNICNSDY